ncbi:MAG: GNAT family N-acetyltransferase [Candidatus Zixiibacteriota bacterium]
MPLKIYSESNIDCNQWAGLSNHSVYSSPEFMAIWKPMGGRTIFIIDENDGKYRAGLAGLVFGNRFMRRFQSMPDGFKGGFYFANDTNEDERSEFVENVIDWFRSTNIIRADIHSPDYELKSKFFISRLTETHIIDLDNDIEKIIDPKISKHIRTGKKRGAEVGKLDCLEDINRFYRLVEMSERKHGGKPRYPKELFQELLGIAMNDDRIGWLAVRNEGQLIASRIFFIENDEIFFWQFYADPDSRSLKPAYLLNEYCLNWAIDNKFKIINLGWSPPLATGLKDYKEKWGGQKRPFHYYTFYGGLGKLLYQWREK